MRKKLLRSRSGFEKPESREEAIMQNILGASNVLEPAESNIEEILQAILYNTPYTKEAEFEIEKILLAIKNNGTYDGEGESRDTKILIAILNDLDYTEEAESRIEELFIEWLQQRSQIKVLEGVPPLTFTSRGLPLINYLIEGNTIQNGTPTPDNLIMPLGTGERTENLFDKTTLENGIYLAANGNKYGDVTNGVRAGVKIKVLPNTAYTLSAQSSANVSLRIFEWSNGTFTTQKPKYNISGNISLTVTTDAKTTEIAFNIEGAGGQYVTNIMLNSGSEALPYEPYGIKIPILSNSTTTPVYLGEVQTTRKIRKIKLEVPSAVKSVTGGYQLRFGIYPYNAINYTEARSYCNIAEWDGNNARQGHVASGSNVYITQPIEEWSTVESATEWLSQHDVFVWYVLATEQTGIVNEPLMRIGDYADTISKEQAGVEIPTVSGSNTLDVDTTVKPSNIYIEYK